MRSSVAIAFFTLLGIGCALEVPGPERGVEQRVSIDASFSADERQSLQSCADEWRIFSEGNVQVVFVESDGVMHLRRGGTFPGGYLKRNRDVWIDVDGLNREGFGASGVKATCKNLLGRLFNVPQHTDRGVLSTDDVVESFTDADRNVCRISGVCS